MSEQETWRLRQAVARLLDAQEEASDTARQGLEHYREEFDDYGEPSVVCRRVEESLMDVLDILGGASTDVREILGNAAEERGKGQRDST